MTNVTNRRWLYLVVINVAAWGVLGFYRDTAAQAPPANSPFANAVDQQGEIINQLKETNRLLREQNAVLRSGTLQVVVTDKKG